MKPFIRATAAACAIFAALAVIGFGAWKELPKPQPYAVPATLPNPQAMAPLMEDWMDRNHAAFLVYAPTD